jgi:hypothetical protein
MKTAQRLPIKYGSGPYVALCYIKMRQTFVGHGELRAIFPKLNEPKKALDRLVACGYATADAKGHVKITPTGITMLYEISKQHAISH